MKKITWAPKDGQVARMTKFPFFPADGQLVRVLEITLLGALVLVNDNQQQH